MAMPKFLEDYTTVGELISKMNKEYPECRLVAEMVDNGDDWVIFKSSFYENKEDTEPKATVRIFFIHFADKLINSCVVL